MPLTNDLAPHQDRWAPRPLITLTVGASTLYLSTETVATISRDALGDEYGGNLGD